MTIIDAVFVAIPLLCLAVAGVWMTASVIARMRRIRYSLGDLLVLFLLTGLGVGLMAKVLPEDWPLAVVTFLSLSIGILLFWIGTQGIRTVYLLEVEGFPRRALIILGNVLVVPIAGGMCAGLVAFIFAVTDSLWGDLENERILVAIVGAATALFCIVLLITVHRLDKRANQVERRQREAEESAAAEEKPPEKPPAPKDPEA